MGNVEGGFDCCFVRRKDEEHPECMAESVDEQIFSAKSDTLSVTSECRESVNSVESMASSEERRILENAFCKDVVSTQSASVSDTTPPTPPVEMVEECDTKASAAV